MLIEWSTPNGGAAVAADALDLAQRLHQVWQEFFAAYGLDPVT